MENSSDLPPADCNNGNEFRPIAPWQNPFILTVKTLGWLVPSLAQYLAVGPDGGMSGSSSLDRVPVLLRHTCGGVAVHDLWLNGVDAAVCNHGVNSCSLLSYVVRMSIEGFVVAKRRSHKV